MARKSNFDKDLEKRIYNLSTRKEKIYSTVGDIDSDSVKSDFGMEAFTIMKDIMSGVTEAGEEEITQRIGRIKQLKKFVREANLGKREQKIILEHADKIHKALAKDASIKRKMMLKASSALGGLVKKVFDAESGITGTIGTMLGDDELVNAILKKTASAASTIGGFVGNTISNKMNSRRENRAALKQDAVSMLDKNKKAVRAPRAAPENQTARDNVVGIGAFGESMSGFQQYGMSGILGGVGEAGDQQIEILTKISENVERIVSLLEEDNKQEINEKLQSLEEKLEGDKKEKSKARVEKKEEREKKSLWETILSVGSHITSIFSSITNTLLTIANTLTNTATNLATLGLGSLGGLGIMKFLKGKKLPKLPGKLKLLLGGTAAAGGLALAAQETVGAPGLNLAGEGAGGASGLATLEEGAVASSALTKSGLGKNLVRAGKSGLARSAFGPVGLGISAISRSVDGQSTGQIIGGTASEAVGGWAGAAGLMAAVAPLAAFTGPVFPVIEALAGFAGYFGGSSIGGGIFDWLTGVSDDANKATEEQLEAMKGLTGALNDNTKEAKKGAEEKEESFWNWLTDEREIVRNSRVRSFGARPDENGKYWYRMPIPDKGESQSALNQVRSRRPYMQGGSNFVTLPLTGDTLRDAAKEIEVHESMREKPYWDVNHLRIGFGTDTIFGRDGSRREVTASSRITEDEARYSLGIQVGQIANDIRKSIGASSWDSLSEASKVALIDTQYNHGTLYSMFLNNAKNKGDAGVADALEYYASLHGKPGKGGKPMIQNPVRKYQLAKRIREDIVGISKNTEAKSVTMPQADQAISYPGAAGMSSANPGSSGSKIPNLGSNANTDPKAPAPMCSTMSHALCRAG